MEINVPAEFGRDRSVNGREDEEQADRQTDRQIQIIV